MASKEAEKTSVHCATRIGNQYPGKHRQQLCSVQGELAKAGNECLECDRD